jgi:hypothetical protein
MFRLLLASVLSFVSVFAHAEPIRVATFNASLARKGPGLLLQDILKGKSKQIANIVAIIQKIRPDVLLINEVDHDLENLALIEFLKVLAKDTKNGKGIHYPHFYAPPQNVGLPSGQDLNGDGKLGTPSDAFGFGEFPGQYAMALVSRFPINRQQAQDFSHVLWKQVPNVEMPKSKDGFDFPSYAALHVMRLSSKGHWDVPITMPNGDVLHVLASHPTPPIFDGPEDLNGIRNQAEILFWNAYIQENFNDPNAKFVVMGDMNADPRDGEGSHSAISTLLSNGFLLDPKPKSKGAVEADETQGYANTSHLGDPALDTADWRDDRGPGNLRVDYVLPSKSFIIRDAGVFWPTPSEPDYNLIGSNGRASSDHRLVWVDLE